MKMTDLKRTEADKTAEAKTYEDGGRIGQEDYPYGTTVHLGHEELAKMGITSTDQLPKSGDTVNIGGHAKVSSTSTSDRDGQARHNMELQITHFGMEPNTDEEKARATAAMYPSAKSA